MTRITPRTCLWPLAGSLCVTFALSLGLTFRSNHHCYAGTCGEWLFPLQARLHVVVWYCWLAISVTILAIRAFKPSMQKILKRSIFEKKMPLLGKELAFSGLLILGWIITLYGVLVGIWWIRLRNYFAQRGIEGGVAMGNGRLAAIALTGHLCDVTMGMAIMPISRHSALASFFKISVSTTLTFHMLTAYTLFTLVLIHGFLYISWVPAFTALSSTLRKVYPVLNPTYIYHETWPGNTSSLGIWRASLIFTGITATFIMFLIFVTTLPRMRNKHFNLFYFTHLLGIVAVVIICLHASTMLYCTAPGLAMWVLDWAMRLYELREPLESSITDLGKGWYTISVPLPRHRLDGCACTSPLAHFYIHNSETSIRELHPFTTITHLASQNAITSSKSETIAIKFLFRKQGKPIPTSTLSSASTSKPPSFEDIETPMPQPAKLNLIPAIYKSFSKLRKGKPPQRTLQWTDRLASLSHSNSSQNSKPIPTPLNLRLEGPYFTPSNPAQYDTVICLVAGTGVSGALAIAAAFKDGFCEGAGCRVDSVRSEEKEKERHKRRWKRCIIVWTLREEQWVDGVVEGVLGDYTSIPGLTFKFHITSSSVPRLNPLKELQTILPPSSLNLSPTQAKTYTYISGPSPFIKSCEQACKSHQEKLSKERRGDVLEWYGARWDI